MCRGISARVLVAMLVLCVFRVGAASAQQRTPRYLDRLPPLIDRELFFGDPEISGAQLSPDGRFLAFRKPYHGVINIWVKGVREPFEAARPITVDTTRPVLAYFWSQDSRYVLYAQDQGGNENYHIYAVDPTAPANQRTGVLPARDLTPYDAVQARIYAVPEATPGAILIGLNHRDPQVHDVYRLDLASGARQLVLQNDENVAGWLADLSGTLRLGTRVAPDGSTEILRIDADSLVTVYTCSNEETCSPIRFHKDGRRVYLVTNKGDDVDLARLVLFDPATGVTEFVESDPENQVDFGGAEFSDVTEELVATYYVGDRLRIYPRDRQFARDLDRLRRKLPEGEIQFGSATKDEALQLITVTRDVDPGSTYLFNRKSGRVELLYRSRPELPSGDLAAMKAMRYRARDGLEIPAYLTTPRNVEPRNLPVVILPHGGPWARDVWGYDAYTQYLANRGYVVLQPNFRGSAGYGKAFLNAGNHEWGTGGMQNDLTDAVGYLVDHGIADPARVGIFGGSYGAYAALAGLAFTPDLYAAGISYVGPSNLITLLKSIPPYWTPIKTIFDVRVGDPDNPEDRERLMAQSPLNSASHIMAPLLVIQGVNDPRVKKAESEQIVVALRDLGRRVEYLAAPDEGHGFAGRENRLAVAAAIERFFAKYLHGRLQEAMPEDIAARLAALRVDVDTLTGAPPTHAATDPALAPLPAADGRVLRPASLRYRTTIETMGQEIELQVNRALEAATEEGRRLWRLVDQVQSPLGTGVDTFELDRVTLEPVRRSASGSGSVTLRFTDSTVTGEIGVRGQKLPIDARLSAPVFGDEAALTIAVAGFPLTADYQTTLRVFDLLTQQARPMSLSVTGMESTESAAGTFPTFVVQLTPLDGSAGGSATMRVLQAAPHFVVRSTTRLPAPMGGGMASSELVALEPGQ